MKITGDITVEAEHRRKMIIDLIAESIVVDRLEESFHKLVNAFGEHVPFGPGQTLSPYLHAIKLTGINPEEEEGYFELLVSIYNSHCIKGKHSSKDKVARKTAEKIYKDWVLATK